MPTLRPYLQPMLQLPLRKMYRGLLGGLLAGLFLGGMPMVAQAQTNEHELKAAFLYKVLHYIDWPTERLQEGTPLKLCAAQDSALLQSLALLSGKQVRSHPFQVRPPSSADGSSSDCHVMLHAPGSKPSAGYPAQMLVISSQKGGLDEGATMDVFIEDKRVQFEVNLVDARRAQLQISAKLLPLARRVRQ
jgi:hypothetical protein